MSSITPTSKISNIRTQGETLQVATPVCHVKKITRKFQQIQKRSEFALASSLLSLVATQAPSQALTQLPGSDEQVLISF